MAASRAGQIASTVVARFFGKGANFLVLVILARALSIDDLGVYGFIFTASILTSVACDVGVRNSVAYYIGRDPSKSADRAKHALLLFIPFGLVGAGVAPLVLMLQGTSLPLHAALVPTMINILSLLFIRMEQGILIGAGQISHFNRTEVVPRTALLGATVVAFMLHEIDLTTALYTLALSNLSGAIAVAVAVVPYIRGGSVRHWADTKTLVGRGFVFMLGVIVMMATQKLAFLILSIFGNEGEAGLFYGLLRLTEVLTEIGMAVSVVIFSNSVRAESKDQAIRDVAESTRLCLVLFVVLAMAAYLLAPILLPIALGEDFAGQETLFRILLVATLVGTVWTMIFPNLSTIEHPIVAFLIMLPNLVFSLLVTWFLHGAFGITGAAWAMVASQAAMTASMLLAFKLRHGVKVRTFLVVSLSDLQGVRGFRRRSRARKGAQD